MCKLKPFVTVQAPSMWQSYWLQLTDSLDFTPMITVIALLYQYHMTCQLSHWNTIWDL